MQVSVAAYPNFRGREAKNLNNILPEKSESLRYLHEFMRLQGDFPFWVFHGIIDNYRRDVFGPAPFGLKVEPASGGNLAGIFLGPGNVAIVVDDHF